MIEAAPGRRWFIAGAIGLIVFASIHLLAVYQSNFGEPATPEIAELDRMLRNVHILDAGPFQASAWHTVELLNTSYSVLLLYAGVLNLLMVGPALASGRLRRITWVNILFVGLLLALTVVFQFLPPMVLTAVVLLLFVVSLIRQRSLGADLEGV
jgi:hypothetical protein